MKKSIASVAAALLVGGTLAFATALPASATPVTECVPSDAIEAYIEDVPDIVHPAVGEPTITIDNPDYVAAVEASTQWWNFAPNDKHGFEGEPSFPEDDRGTWVGPHTEGGPGQDQSGTYQQGEGHGSWFHRVNTPGSDAIGEPTIVVDNPEYVAEYTEITPDIEHPAVPAVVCETPVEPVVCVASGWYTESDDVAPVEIENGLLFEANGSQAVGLRAAASGNLQGWTSLSFDASNIDEFFFRLTISSPEDGFTYKSLSFPGTSTITQDSVVYQTGLTLAETAELYPNATITSIGFQTNSGAVAGYQSVLSSVNGCGLDVSFVPVVEEPEEPVTPEEPVEPTPEPEQPVVTPEPTETPVPVAAATTTTDATTLASTGGNDGWLVGIIGAILALGGTALFFANHALKARKRV
jgi:hypothetical protein